VSNKQLRNLIRAGHLGASALLIGLIYIDTLRMSPEYVMLLRLVVIPVVAVSGIAMWQQAFLSRLRRG
jgi:hypothetical protein